MSARTSAFKRARAARLIREGKTYAEAGRAIGRDRRTITRWMEDESFLNMLHAHGVLSAGPLRVRAAVDDVLHDLPSEESWLWVSVPDASVLGSLVVEDATHLRVAFVPPERVPFVRGELEQKRFPVLAGERTTVLVPEALGALQEQEACELLVRLGSADPAEAFRAFLSLWRFRAQETMDIRLLGEGLWPAQELLIEEIASHPHVYALKARKLGHSTIACAYDAFVLRFRDQNARVHLFSRGERAALELLTAVRFGLDRLPSWLRLPAVRTTMREVEYDAGRNDRRLVVCYPTTDAVAVEATATHSHIDEWSDMPRPDVVYQSLEPTFTAPGCTSLIVTTGAGPANPSADYWRRCLAGDGLHRPLFIPATARPDRGEAWLAEKKRTMLPSAFQTEYALTWQDAIAGTNEFVFSPKDIDAAGIDFYGLGPAKPRHKYVKAWDIGQARDATVGICLDVTEEPNDVVAYVRLRGRPYPVIQAAIEQMHRTYPGLTVIEKNAMGAAVLENLHIAEHELEGFTTTAQSKARIIQNLAVQLQSWLIRYDPKACAQLDAELRGYQEPDTHCVQDSVIALAIALEHAARAQTQGRILAIICV